MMISLNLQEAQVRSARQWNSGCFARKAQKQRFDTRQLDDFALSIDEDPRACSQVAIPNRHSAISSSTGWERRSDFHTKRPIGRGKLIASRWTQGWKEEGRTGAPPRDEALVV